MTATGRGWFRPSRDWLILASVLAMSLLLRLGSFPRTVFDMDEAVFLLMGRDILRGHLPYAMGWEHSPVGGMVLFAAIQALFGQSVLAIRIATWLAAALESYLLYRVGGTVGKPGAAAGVLAGLIHMLYALNNQGLAAQREMFLAPLVTLAVYLLLSSKSRPKPFGLFLAGLAMGCALQLKYMYVFEFIAVLVIASGLTLSAGNRTEMPRALLKTWAPLAAGPILCLALAAAPFLLSGRMADFVNMNFRSAVVYVLAEPVEVGYFIRVLIWEVRKNPMIWLGAFLAPVYLCWAKEISREERRNLLYLLTWFVLAFLGTCATRKFFDHYYLQLLAPGSLITALVLTGVLRGVALDRPRYVLALILFLAGPAIAVGYPHLYNTAVLAYRRYVVGAPLPVDGPRAAADYLRSHMTREDILYVADYEPIVYYLVDAKIPTRFFFPQHLTLPVFAAEGIDQMGEFRKIMEQRPLYVVRQAPPTPDLVNQELAAELTARLARDYVLAQSLPANATYSGQPVAVEVYRLRSGP